MIKKLITAATIITLAGCIQPETEQTDLPEDLVAYVMTMDKADQMPVLSAVWVLVQADMIAVFEWTAATAGSEVEYYQTEAACDVPGRAIYILRSGKTNITVRARGVDSEGRRGHWSEESDTTQAGK